MKGETYRDVIAGVGVDEEAIAEQELLVAALMEGADLARRRARDFFNFVLRHEKTNAQLTCAPHQRLVFDFIEAHPRCVLRLPVGTSKTFLVTAQTMFLLGTDQTSRGAIVSATQNQAMKPVSMVRDYIESSHELRLVFPKLRKSIRKTDTWSQESITVDRPAGIRDASLRAVGLDGAIDGSRLNWIVIDDILNRENTATKASREKVYEWFDTSVLSRIDPDGGRIVVCNTPWHPDDLTYKLEAAGWPTLTMDVEGNIVIANCGDDCMGCHGTWDSDEIVGSARPGEIYRLTAHLELQNDLGLVIAETQPLWPDRYSWETIRELREGSGHEIQRFNSLYMCVCRSEETAKCKIEWIERCKANGVGTTVAASYAGSGLTITGVDLAVGKGAQYDFTAYFTFEQLEDGRRRILDVEFGQYDAPTIVSKLIDKSQKYKSLVMVENNACFVPGTPVLTKRGYVPIESVEAGDEVWTHRARWRRVIERTDGTARIACEARARGSLPVKTTPNHWFWLREAGRAPGRAGGEHRPIGDPTWVSIGFPEKQAYAAIAIPRWDKEEARLVVGDRAFDVDEELALAIGLFMAEGHATKRQVFFTFARHEEHLAAFVTRILRRLSNGAIGRTLGDGTLRVRVSDTALARLFKRFGKSEKKRPPIEWYGWPLVVRLAMVRGWLMGDGCVRTNNAKTEWPRPFLSGASISRDWMLFARTALLESGYRATLGKSESRPSVIAGRTLNRRSIFTIALPTEDSSVLRQEMKSAVERAHWPSIPWTGRRSNASVVLDGEHAWARVVGPTPGGPFEEYNGPVFNLVVDEDESFTVDDYVVHNAQDYIRQFVLAKNASVPVKAHTTGRGKAHPEYGLEGLFIEMMNGAWIIPCSSTGAVAPGVAKWIEECLYYRPEKHPGDVLMASWLGVELARQLGFSAGARRGGGQTLGLAASLLAR